MVLNQEDLVTTPAEDISPKHPGNFYGKRDLS